MAGSVSTTPCHPHRPGAATHSWPWRAGHRPDYASRRSGGEDENNRRHGGGGALPPSGALAQAGRDTFVTGANASYNPYGGRETGDANGRPHIDPRAARRKSVDYAARRSGGRRDENASRHGMAPPRRSEAAQNGAPSSLNGSQPSSGYGSSNERDSQRGAPPIDPRVARRRSASYSARRSASDGENRERHGPASSGSAPHASPAPSAREGSGGSPPMDPRVARRRSVDYAARRSGRSGGGAERHRSGSTLPPSSLSPPPASASSDSDFDGGAGGRPAMDPRVARRRSVDYSARRSGRGSTGGEVRSRHSAPPPPAPPARSPPPPAPETRPLPARGGGTPPMDPRVARRRSVDYSARRSSNSRSSDARAPPRRSSSPVPPPSAQEQPRQGGGGAPFSLDGSRLPRPAMDPRVLRRRSVDYSARRSGSERAGSNGVRAAAPRGDGERRQVPVRRKQAPSYEARRSGDHTRQRRLRQEYTLAQVKSALAMRPDSAMPGAAPSAA